MWQAALAQQVDDAARGSGLRIPRPEDDAVNARGEDGARAEHARFEGDDERASGELPVAVNGSGLAKGDDLGVRGGVVMFLTLIAAPADDGPPRVEHDGTHRHIARLEGSAGLGKSGSHRRPIALGDRRHALPFR